MYQATIFFDTEEDVFENGATGNHGTSWTEKLEAETPEELKGLVLAATYSRTDDDLYQDNCNDYPDANEYWANYYADINNVGEASESQIEEWKKGKCRLWTVGCHILVSEITKTKAAL